jgi:hypothetical protein
MRKAFLALACCAALLAVPAAAAAATYCVGWPGPDCDGGTYPATGAALQDAIDAADTNAPISGVDADTVRIGPGTFVNGPGYITQGGGITFVGAGPSTVLETDGHADRTVLRALAPADGVHNLSANITGLRGTGITGFKNVSDVHVGGPGTATMGIKITSGGRLTRAVVDPAKVDEIGVEALGGSVVEDLSLRVRGVNTAPEAIALAAGRAGGASETTFRHVSAVGGGRQNDQGLLVLAETSSVTVHLRDVLLHGFGTPFRRIPNSGRTASVDYSYSALDGDPSHSVQGPGTVTAGPGNIGDPDPLLANDLSPLPGSPLIDRGDPAAPEGADSATDAGGNPRIRGGRRDIGAFEAPASVSTPSSLADQIAPSLSEAELTRRRFRAGRLATAQTTAKRRRKVPVGTSIRYTLSEAATVTLRVDRKLPGRRVVRRGRKQRVCVKPTKHNATRKNRRCTLVKGAGTLTRKQSVGPQRVAFSGRIGRRKLKPGKYRLTVGARDAAGNTGPSRALTFTIVK